MTTYDIELTDIAHGGVCVGRADDGRVVFARFGLPGETVRVRETSQRAKLIRGDVVDVLSDPSEHRVATQWPEAGPLGVGGADLGHVAFGFQAQWKTHVLRETLARIGGRDLVEELRQRGIDCTVRAVDGDEATGGWASRTRVEFVVSDGGRPAMHREGTRDLVEVSGLPLAVEDIGELDLFGAWRHRWRPGERVRAVAPSGSDPVVAIGESVWWAPGMEAERYVREDVVAGGELYSYRVRAAGFWQAHHRAASELISSVLAMARIEPGEAVVELYAGAGMLTQPLAQATGPTGGVWAFEGVREATQDARANLRDFPWAKVQTAAIGEHLARDLGGDVIVADPPRSGLGKKLARQLALAPVSRIVLVSCDVAAMARDVAAMREAGMTVTGLDAIDLFPNTHHVECVVAMSKRR
ncbi:MAG: TRAM domain-containing protein [Actinomycetaceae bacterium]|nr:TRAM domain-containing protein [Actinomycetaceae bacterium]